MSSVFQQQMTKPETKNKFFLCCFFRRILQKAHIKIDLLRILMREKRQTPVSADTETGVCIKSHIIKGYFLKSCFAFSCFSLYSVSPTFPSKTSQSPKSTSEEVPERTVSLRFRTRPTVIRIIFRFPKKIIISSGNPSMLIFRIQRPRLSMYCPELSCIRGGISCGADIFLLRNLSKMNRVLCIPVFFCMKSTWANTPP